MRCVNRVTCLALLVFLFVGIPITSKGETIRLPFSGQFQYRTESFQNGNQSAVNDTVGKGRLFGIFINTTLYYQISDSIDTYIADLESDGWQVVLYTFV